jgi:ketosteroid isomerase-like protein
MLRSTWIAIVLFLMIVVAGNTDASDVRSLEATNARMTRAASARDLNGVMACVHADFVSKDPEGRSIGRGDYERHLRGVYSQPWEQHRISVSNESAIGARPNDLTFLCRVVALEA